jgi:hypothetical protein
MTHFTIIDYQSAVFVEIDSTFFFFPDKASKGKHGEVSTFE